MPTAAIRTLQRGKAQAFALLAVMILLAAFPAGGLCEAIISIDPASARGVFTPELLGVNVQWTTGCDGLQDPSGAGFSPQVMARVKELSPPLVRFPGGLLSSTQDWRMGIGPKATRGLGTDFLGKKEKMLCGTDEFLALLRQIGASGMMTANLTRSAEETGQWLAYVRQAGGNVPWWEIGNESYFNQDPSFVSAKEYAARFSAFSQVLHDIDPGVRVGAVLEGSLDGADWVKHLIPEIASWNEKVVTATASMADFYTVHLYAPFNHGKTAESTVRAILAAPAALEANLSKVCALVRKAKPDAGVFVTEFNVLTDNALDNWNYGVTLAQAGYTAQMLCAFARNGVTGANFWSLVGNHNFGLIKSRDDPRLRPAGMLYAGLRPLAGSKVLQTAVQGPAFEYQGVGSVPAGMPLPVIAAQGFDAGGACLAVVVNRDPANPRQISVRLGGAQGAAAFTARVLTGSGGIASNEKQQGVDWLPETTPGTVLTLPPASTALLHVRTN